MILAAHLAPDRVGGDRRLAKHVREVESGRFPVLESRFDIESIDTANHLIDRTEPKLRHQLPHFLCQEAEELFDELRLAGELLAQLGVLRCHAYRARIEMADAHHDAASDDERCGGEPEFLGSEQRRNHHVAPGLQLSVDLDDDAVAQVIQHQDLLRLGEPEFPGNAAVLDGRQRRRAGSAIVTRDQHHIGVRLRDPGGDRPNAYFRDQFHVHARDRVGVLEIENELREIFD